MALLHKSSGLAWQWLGSRLSSSALKRFHSARYVLAAGDPPPIDAEDTAAVEGSQIDLNLEAENEDDSVELDEVDDLEDDEDDDDEYDDGEFDGIDEEEEDLQVGRGLDDPENYDEEDLAVIKANKFSIGDTEGVEEHEYAAAYPDKYILKVFQHQQRAYRRYLRGLKNVSFPDDLSDSSVGRFAMQIEKLKLKAGLPTSVQFAEGQLLVKATEGENSVRKLLESISGGYNLGISEEMREKMVKALDEVESTHGPVPLNSGKEDQEAAKAYSAKVGSLIEEVKLASESNQEKQTEEALGDLVSAYREKLDRFIEDEAQQAAQVYLEMAKEDFARLKESKQLGVSLGEVGFISEETSKLAEEADQNLWAGAPPQLDDQTFESIESAIVNPGARKAATA